MAEAAGWISALLVGAIAVVWRMYEKARAEAVRASLRAESGVIVEAQRAAAVEATRASVEEIADLVQGDDPEGSIADRLNDEASR